MSDLLHSLAWAPMILSGALTDITAAMPDAEFRTGIPVKVFISMVEIL
jgi:hypothetical protein